jgi:hypothetical protein
MKIKLDKTIFFFLLGLIVVLIGFLTSEINFSDNIFTLFGVSLFVLFLLFFMLLFAHKGYEKSIHHIHPSLALAFSYALIILNMFFGSRIYSLEWAFLGFLAITVIFYDFKIDSRFLILPAILLLGYLPFLLVGRFDSLAEVIAVYVYYFLVVGVVLQIIEYVKKTENTIDFDSFIKRFFSKEKIYPPISIWGIFTIGVIIFNRFNNLELLKWTSIYVFVVLLVFYLISFLQRK